MNTALLSRQFPELQPLPPEQRERLLREAHERAYAPERKLEHWRRNVFSLIVITGACLALTVAIGPALGLGQAAIAGVIMVLVLPAFMFWRHRQYVRQLRPELAALMRQREWPPE